MNAFFNIFGVFYDLFRVINFLFSVIQKVHAEEHQDVAKILVLVVIHSLILFELMHTLTFTLVVFLTVTLQDNVRLFAKNHIYSTVIILALDSIEWLLKSFSYLLLLF